MKPLLKDGKNNVDGLLGYIDEGENKVTIKMNKPGHKDIKQALNQEINRTRKLFQICLETPGQIILAGGIDVQIKIAEKAIEDNDDIGMFKAYESLKGIREVEK